MLILHDCTIFCIFQSQKFFLSLESLIPDKTSTNLITYSTKEILVSASFEGWPHMLNYLNNQARELRCIDWSFQYRLNKHDVQHWHQSHCKEHLITLQPRPSFSYCIALPSQLVSIPGSLLFVSALVPTSVPENEANSRLLAFGN